MTEHLELFNILFGGINFVIYILIMKRNERKNILLYYVSAMLWNWLAMYEVRGDEGDYGLECTQSAL